MPPPGTYVALLRGINVGRAKQVAMADLREVLLELGYTSPRTVLRSGNAVFEAADPPPAGAAAQLREALERRTGVSAAVVLLTAAELAEVVRDNPLLEWMTDPSRLLVAFLGETADAPLLASLADRDWRPEAYATAGRVAYLWCPDGVLAGRLPAAVEALPTAGPVTVRNWRTVLKVQAAVAGQTTAGARSPVTR